LIVPTFGTVSVHIGLLSGFAVTSEAVSAYVKLVGYVVLVSLVFYPFELLAPAEKGQNFVKRLINLVYVPVILGLMIFVAQPVANVVADVILRAIGGSLLFTVLVPENGVPAQIVLAILYVVTWDFFQYWLHRWQHKSLFLWQTHRFHHSETALNATTQTRHHLFSIILSIAFYFPLLIIIGRSPHAWVSLVMFRFWPFLNHANVRLPFGPLTPVISGPQWHRIHHSIDPEHRDKNFATFLPFIDIVFGTYYRPSANEYPATGIAGENNANILRDATVQPLVSWSRQTISAFSRRPVASHKRI